MEELRDILPGAISTRTLKNTPDAQAIVISPVKLKKAIKIDDASMEKVDNFFKQT